MGISEFVDRIMQKMATRAEDGALNARTSTKKLVRIFLDSMGEATAAHLAESPSNYVTIPGLGKLTSSYRKPRTARNPATGEEVDVPGKLVVKFSPCKAFREALVDKE